jgi:hypothetical protein
MCSVVIEHGPSKMHRLKPQTKRITVKEEKKRKKKMGYVPKLMRL